jgi:hypothetical protein
MRLLPRLEDERKSRAVWYEISRQSPKLNSPETNKGRVSGPLGLVYLGRFLVSIRLKTIAMAIAPMIIVNVNMIGSQSA